MQATDYYQYAFSVSIAAAFISVAAASIAYFSFTKARDTLNYKYAIKVLPKFSVGPYVSAEKGHFVTADVFNAGETPVIISSMRLHGDIAFHNNTSSKVDTDQKNIPLKSGELQTLKFLVITDNYRGKLSLKCNITAENIRNTASDNNIYVCHESI